MVLIEKLVFDHKIGLPISRSAVKHGIKLERARKLLAKGIAFERNNK
jgi:hypothetical protein